MSLVVRLWGNAWQHAAVNNTPSLSHPFTMLGLRFLVVALAQKVRAGSYV